MLNTSGKEKKKGSFQREKKTHLLYNDACSMKSGANCID